jgi:hypothetical protein
MRFRDMASTTAVRASASVRLGAYDVTNTTLTSTSTHSSISSYSSTRTPNADGARRARSGRETTGAPAQRSPSSRYSHHIYRFDYERIRLLLVGGGLLRYPLIKIGRLPPPIINATTTASSQW